jgi:hypothetical protein
MMLDYITSWLDKNISNLEIRGVKITEQFRTPDDISEPASYVDLENEVCYARITVWENGNCDIEALDIESGENIFWIHLEIVDTADIDAAFNLILEKMTSVKRNDILGIQPSLIKIREK